MVKWLLDGGPWLRWRVRVWGGGDEGGDGGEGVAGTEGAADGFGAA